MDWRSESAAGLPLPRDDEPGALRDELVDELADHLHCAMQRELAKKFDSNAAEQNVRRRFGDPRAILRKLWFDAMKEKIMSQRLTIAAVLVLTCTSIAATAFAWVAVRESRESSAAMATAVRDANLALIEKLVKPAPSPQPLPVASPAPQTGWSPVTIKLVLDNLNGPPAVGYQATFAEQSEKNVKINLEKVSNAAGEINFGRVPAGSYYLQVETPWGETLGRTNLVPPDEPFSETIVCPSMAIPEAEVTVELESRAPLADKKGILLFDFVGTPVRTVGGHAWNRAPATSKYNFTAAFDTTGRLLCIDPGYTSHLTTPISSHNRRELVSVADVLWRRLQEPPAALPGAKIASPQCLIQAVQVIAASSVNDNRSAATSTHSFRAKCLTLHYDSGSADPDIQLPPELKGEFRAPQAGKGVWKISLPDSFVKLATDFIASEDQISAADKDARGLQLPVEDNVVRNEHDVVATAEAFLTAIGLKEYGYPDGMQYDSDYPYITEGVSVHWVQFDSPASKAGIKSQDLLFGLGPWLVTRNRSKNASIARSVKPGQALKYYVLRQGEVHQGELVVPDETWLAFDKPLKFKREASPSSEKPE